MATSIAFTQKGEEWLAGVLAGALASTPVRIASGTGTTAAVKGDTALETEVESRVAGVRSQVGTNGDTLRVTGTIKYTANRTITEFGLFSSDDAHLLVRATFDGGDAKVVAALDSIVFTLDLPVA